MFHKNLQVAFQNSPQFNYLHIFLDPAEQWQGC